MHTSRFAAWCLRLTVLIVLGNLSHGCQPQVCRRRREVVFENKVRLKVYGCTGKSPPWVRQVAFCLNLRVSRMALGIKDWYLLTYRKCRRLGCQKYITNRVNENIPDCVKCWEREILKPEVVGLFNIPAETIRGCVIQYIESYLNSDLPQLRMEERYKGSIDLAHVRPAEFWWSVKVELPCKPKIFTYLNAYCINSFGRNLREGDYLLVQNNIISKDEIKFWVEFSDTCMFEPEDIRIIWDESTPAPALVQTSPFPSQFPPIPDEPVTIHYDLEAAKRLMFIEEDKVPEYRIARDRVKKSRRGKREAENSNMGRIGLIFPCAVASFKAIDSDSRIPYSIFGAGDQFLIDSNGFRDEDGRVRRTSQMNFTLDYGFDRTGCFFDTADIVVVPNPPSELFSRRPIPKNKRIWCLTCVNRLNDKDCFDRGSKKYCEIGEVCQTEVRQISEDSRLVTKTCKQQYACATNSRGKKSGQCRPGEPGSVCRCCCHTDMCNLANEHNFGESFTCKNGNF